MHRLFTYKKADNNKKDRRRTLYVMISDDILLKQREKEHCSIYSFVAVIIIRQTEKKTEKCQNIEQTMSKS